MQFEVIKQISLIKNNFISVLITTEINNKPLAFCD